MSEREALWRIDVVMLAMWLLVVLLFAQSCCSARPLGVGFLEGMGALSQKSAQKWQSEIESECGGGAPPAEPSEPSSSWWRKWWGN